MNINKHVTTDNLDVAPPMMGVGHGPACPARYLGCHRRALGGRLAGGRVRVVAGARWAHTYVVLRRLNLGTLAGRSISRRM